MFKPPGASLPYLLFYVAPNPAANEGSVAEAQVAEDKDLWRMVERSAGGKNIVRKHVIHMRS